MFAGALDFVSNWITVGVSNAVVKIMNLVMGLLFSRALDPDFLSSDGFFLAGNSTGDNTSVYGKTFFLGLVLLLMFLAAAVIGSIVRGEPSAAIRSLFLDLPLAVFFMVFAVAIVNVLLNITNGISEFFLSTATQDLEAFMQVLSGYARFGGNIGFFTVLLIGAVTILAGLLLAIILLFRMAFLYLIVAFLPLVFASMVWPAVRQSLRKGIELLLGLLFAKPAIALAIAVGAAALGSVTNPGDNQEDAAIIMYCQDALVSEGTACTSGEGVLVYTQGLREVHEFRGEGDLAAVVAEWGADENIEAVVVNNRVVVPAAARFLTAQRFADQGYFTSDRCGTVNNYRTSTCDFAAIQAGQTVIVDDMVFSTNGDVSTLVGRLGAELNPAAAQADWRLIPVDQVTGLLVPDTTPDTPAISDADKQRGLVVQFDSSRIGNITNIVPGASGGGAAVTTTVAGAVPATTIAGATRTANAALSASDVVFQQIFNCQLRTGAALNRTEPAFTRSYYDYEGCVRTFATEDAAYQSQSGGLFVKDDGTVMMNGGPIGAVQVERNEDDGGLMAIITGAVLMLAAAFSPFLLLRLFPLLELAVLASAAEKPLTKVGGLGLNLGGAVDLGKRVGQVFGSSKVGKSGAGGASTGGAAAAAAAGSESAADDVIDVDAAGRSGDTPGTDPSGGGAGGPTGGAPLGSGGAPSGGAPSTDGSLPIVTTDPDAAAARVPATPEALDGIARRAGYTDGAAMLAALGATAGLGRRRRVRLNQAGVPNAAGATPPSGNGGTKGQTSILKPGTRSADPAGLSPSTAARVSQGGTVVSATRRTDGSVQVAVAQSLNDVRGQYVPAPSAAPDSSPATAPVTSGRSRGVVIGAAPPSVDTVVGPAPAPVNASVAARPSVRQTAVVRTPAPPAPAPAPAPTPNVRAPQNVRFGPPGEGVVPTINEPVPNRTSRWAAPRQPKGAGWVPAVRPPRPQPVVAAPVVVPAQVVVPSSPADAQAAARQTAQKFGGS